MYIEFIYVTLKKIKLFILFWIYQMYVYAHLLIDVKIIHKQKLSQFVVLFLHYKKYLGSYVLNLAKKKIYFLKQLLVIVHIYIIIYS